VNFEIRKTQDSDRPAIETVLDATFGAKRQESPAYRLREEASLCPDLSFVICVKGSLCASIAYWHLQLHKSKDPCKPCACVDRAILLGPLAVSPQYRGQDFGTVLISHSLRIARTMGHKIVVLIGDLPFYERFGFSADPCRNWKLPVAHDPSRLLTLHLDRGLIPGSRYVNGLKKTP